MAINLTRECELADQLGWTVAKTAEKRRREKWPHVDFGRFDKRYTDAQIEAIIAMHVVTPSKTVAPDIAAMVEGQTARSRKRAS